MLELYTPPTAEPVSLVQAKAFLRVDSTDDDVLIAELIRGARAYIEHMTGRQFVVCTYKLHLDAFPSRIVLPRPPVVSVSSITYVDTGGTTQTLAAANYTLKPYSEPAEVIEAYGKSWPSTQDVENAVTVTYVAGHGCPFATTFATDLLTTSGRTYTDVDIVRVATTDGDLPGGLAVATDYHVRDVAASTMKLAATTGGVAIALTDDGTGTHFVGRTYDHEPMPDQAQQAILQVVAHWYEHREAVTEAKLSKQVAFAVDSMIWNLKTKVGV